MKLADQSVRSAGTEYPVSSLIVAQCSATSSTVGADPGCPDPVWT
jgi:hypothetical protein